VGSAESIELGGHVDMPWSPMAGDLPGNYQPPPLVMKRRMKRSCSEWELTYTSLSIESSDKNIVPLDLLRMLSIGGPIRQGKSIRQSPNFRAIANDSRFAVAFHDPRTTIVTIRCEVIDQAMES
jgi:hypothetical protein